MLETPPAFVIAASVQDADKFVFAFHKQKLLKI
jgi:hypothetical protein